MHSYYFDIINITLLSISSFLGFWSGFTKLLINTFCSLFSIFLGFILFPFVLELLQNKIQSEIILNFTTGIIAYLVSYILFYIIKIILLKLTSFLSKNFIDRFIGFIFGIIRGGILSIIIILTSVIVSSGTYLSAKNIGNLINVRDDKKLPLWINDSRTYKIYKKIKIKFKNYFPLEYKNIENYEITNLENLINKGQDNDKENNNTQ